jgi:transmembrane sensor
MDNLEKIKLLAEKYLKNDISEEERAELFDWLNDDVLLWMWFKDNIDSSSADMPHDVQQRIFERITESRVPDSPEPKRTLLSGRWLKRLAVACMIVILGGVTFMALHHDNLSGDSTASNLIVKTNGGERSSVVLPDGTKVRLNSMSTITYHLDDALHERIVDLDGEAYFEVQHDESRPFKVTVDGLDVECLGTKFNVKGYDEDGQIYVILKEGSVRVSSSTSSVLMRPNTLVTYDKATARISERGEAGDDYLSWVNGEISYYNESLENITKDLSRTFMVNIVIRTPRLKNEKFTGYLGSTSLKGVLNILTKVSDIDYKFVSDSTIYIFEKGGKP